MLDNLSSNKIGILVLTASILLAAVFFSFTESIKSTENQACEIQCGGEKTCPMEESTVEKVSYYLISSTIVFLAGLGAILYRSDEENLVLGEETKLEAILSVLTTEEKEVIKAVKKQEGIKQSTLKYRVNYSKAKLSRVLKELEEERNLIEREKSGKTKKIFLKEDFKDL